MSIKFNNSTKKQFHPKKLIIILFIVSIFTSSLVAQDFASPPDLQISLHPEFNYQAGSIGEYLFNKNEIGTTVNYAPTGTKQISFLQWDINAMLAATLNLDVQYKSFVVSVNGSIGIPMKAGKMDDYDWNTTKGHQTHFSTHFNKITSHYVAGGLVGWEFSSSDRRFKVLPMMGFSWEKTSMMSYGGYRQYVPDNLQETTPWTDDIEKKSFTGNVISYSHEVFQIDCVLSLTYHLNSKFYLNLDGSIHPILGVYGFDTHILRDLQFLDYSMNGQIGFGVAFTVGYQIVPQHFITLKVDYNYLPVVTGQTYIKNVNQKYYYPDHSSMGGASHWFVGVSLGWKFNIFQ